MKLAPDLDDTLKVLAWAIRKPENGTFHLASNTAFTEQRLLPNVPSPSGFSWNDRFTFPAPNYDFPYGDWIQGSEVFEYVISSNTQRKYKITYKLVNMAYATSLNLDPFLFGFVELVLGTFDFLTRGLFEDYMGVWVISSIKEVLSVTNPSLSGQILEDTFIVDQALVENKNTIETKNLVLAGLAAFLIYSAATAPKKLVQRIGVIGAGYTTWKIFGKK